MQYTIYNLSLRDFRYISIFDKILILIFLKKYFWFTCILNVLHMIRLLSARARTIAIDYQMM